MFSRWRDRKLKKVKVVVFKNGKLHKDFLLYDLLNSGTTPQFLFIPSGNEDVYEASFFRDNKS